MIMFNSIYRRKVLVLEVLRFSYLYVFISLSGLTVGTFWKFFFIALNDSIVHGGNGFE